MAAQLVVGSDFNYIPVMSIYGYQRYVAVWVALAVVFFLAATMNFRRRRVAK